MPLIIRLNIFKWAMYYTILIIIHSSVILVFHYAGYKEGFFRLLPILYWVLIIGLPIYIVTLVVVITKFAYYCKYKTSQDKQSQMFSDTIIDLSNISISFRRKLIMCHDKLRSLNDSKNKKGKRRNK